MTSIGKIVPIMTAADRAAKVSTVYSERFNSLLVDEEGFLFGISDISVLRKVMRLENCFLPTFCFISRSSRNQELQGLYVGFADSRMEGYR